MQPCSCTAALAGESSPGIHAVWQDAACHAPACMLQPRCRQAAPYPNQGAHGGRAGEGRGHTHSLVCAHTARGRTSVTNYRRDRHLQAQSPRLASGACGVSGPAWQGCPGMQPTCAPARRRPTASCSKHVPQAGKRVCWQAGRQVQREDVDARGVAPRKANKAALQRRSGRTGSVCIACAVHADGVHADARPVSCLQVHV